VVVVDSVKGLAEALATMALGQAVAVLAVVQESAAPAAAEEPVRIFTVLA
jgi:hypothetical protein